MIKGTRKQMIVLRTGDSRYFDTAYFVLRERADRAARETDILSEANRILSESTAPSSAHSERAARRRPFLLGMLLGSLTTLLLLAVPMVSLALSSGRIF